MATNFDFLKRIDKPLFDIISEAEKLYRDEYFDQCMTQTRRFGENVCKNVLGARAVGNFDNMLATLKDKGNSFEQEKEFIQDLYFLKKHGNESAHSLRVKKSGMEALECLQRAFEVAINYCVYAKKSDSDILKLRYDTELLVTGEKSKKTLAEKYKEQKAKSNKPKPVKQSYTMNTKTKKTGISGFWIFVCISCVLTTLLFASMFIAIKFF